MFCCQGKTLSPPLLYQQSVRCRNMSELYYIYEPDFKPRKRYECKYETLADCEKKIEKMIMTNKKLTSICTNINENDDVGIVKNLFFKLYVRNEYAFDCYKSNIIYYFEKILKEQGFILSEYESDAFDDTIKNDIDVDDKPENNDELFEEYIKSENKEDPKYEKINNRINLLGLEGDMNEYKNIISTEKKFTEHLDVSRVIKANDHLDMKMEELNNKSYMVKYINNPYNKIKLMRTLMDKYGMGYFDIEHKMPDLREINVENADWEHYKKVFRISKEKPKNMYELNIDIVRMIKHITCPEIINTKRTKYKGRYYYLFSLNDEFIKYHIDANKFTNYNSYHEDIRKRYNLIPKENDDNVFLDE